MPAVDPKKIRLVAEGIVGPLAAGPATFGVLPEGLSYETPDRQVRRLLRSEPCLFLGPPARSKLLLVAAILDRSERADDPVREIAVVSVADLAGTWPTGLEDATTRFPAKDVELGRPEIIALEKGTVVFRLSEEKGAAEGSPLPHATPAIAVGRERGGRKRRAVVLVRGTRTLEPAYYDDGSGLS